MSPYRWIPIAGCLLALASPARADNHKWEIVEIFSSVDETVQFVELFNADKDEHNLGETSISTASGSFFAFPRDLPSSATENRRVLLATAAFAAIPGAPTPDYVIPAGFLDHLGDTVTYAATPHSVGFGPLPIDGVKSINAAGVMATNSPTNFAGLSGSVVLATAVARNGSGVNRLCYTSVPPALGKPWTAVVDASSHPGALGALLEGYARPLTGPRLPAGQLLVDVTSQRYFRIAQVVIGGQATFSAQMPVDAALVGRLLSTQPVIYGGGFELCNAVDMKVGW
jgi:hypothetical protein